MAIYGFLFPRMAKEDKPIRLTPVDEESIPPISVVRLGQDDAEDPVRLLTPDEIGGEKTRLDLPSKELVNLRTHQPGIEVILEPLGESAKELEETWEEAKSQQKPTPWGWFFLIAVAAIAAVSWSLIHVKNAQESLQSEKKEQISTLDEDEKEEMESLRLVDQIDNTIRGYYTATTVDELVRHVRHPERVEPMIREYYDRKTTVFDRMAKSIRGLQPLTLDKKANFFTTNVILSDGKTRSVILEILPSGEAKIDWETLVGYQPMNWDRFATTRPQNEPMDFRVIVSIDNFFSHEFADAEKWTCFKLTARDSEETLFGYAQRQGEVEQSLLKVIQQNNWQPTAMILRLSIPVQLQSRKGVVIEKLVSPRWIIVDPPDSGT